MHRDDRLVAVHLAIDQPRHELVALRVKPELAVRLRHAERQLAVAQVVVGRNGNLLGTADLRPGRVLPVDGAGGCSS